MIYVCSDHHFFHKNIIRYCARPFKNVEEMNNVLIEKHNEVVEKKDLCIFLGDLSCGLKGRTEELKEIMSKMNGQKILIKGNHDHLSNKEYLSLGFNGVYEYLEIGKFFLNHYPLIENKYSPIEEKEMINIYSKSKCSEIIHGHIHKRSTNVQNRHNACLDFNNFYPLNLEDLEKEKKW